MAVVLHWIHLVAMVGLAGTGLLINLLQSGSHAHLLAASLHKALMPWFLLSAVFRVAWSFVGEGSAERGAHHVRADWRHFVWNRGDSRIAIAVLRRYLKQDVTVPATGKYNPLQKIAYTVVFPACITLLAVTGLAIHPSFNIALAPVNDALGGAEITRLVHLDAMWLLLALTGGHVYAAVSDSPGRVSLMMLNWIPGRYRASDADAEVATD